MWRKFLLFHTILVKVVLVEVRSWSKFWLITMVWLCRAWLIAALLIALYHLPLVKRLKLLVSNAPKLSVTVANGQS